MLLTNRGHLEVFGNILVVITEEGVNDVWCIEARGPTKNLKMQRISPYNRELSDSKYQ